MDFFEIHGWDSSTGASAARGANFAPKPPVVPVAPAACAGLVKREGEKLGDPRNTGDFLGATLTVPQFHSFFDKCLALHSVKFGQSCCFLDPDSSWT